MSLTPIEYANKLRSQLLELQQTNKPLLLAATSTTSDMASRIFIEGKGTDGGKIGNYNDTKIMYLNPDDPNVFGRSKIGEPGKFKNGNNRKTVKLTYKGYKSKLGKPQGGAFVNLELSGDMKSDFTNNAPLGDSRILEKISANEYLVRWKAPINAEKAEGNEKRFKQIFKLTAGEKKLFFDVAEFELRKLFA